MFKWLILILLLMSSFIFNVHAAEGGVARLEFSQIVLPNADVQALRKVSAARDVTRMLFLIAQIYPDLRLLIFPIAAREVAADWQKVLFHDGRLSIFEEQALYSDFWQYERDQEATVWGRFFAADARIAHPLLIVRDYSAKHIVLHELIHYLIDREKLRQLRLRGLYFRSVEDWSAAVATALTQRLSRANNAREQFLVSLDLLNHRLREARSELGEELDVVQFLSEQREWLGISARQIDQQKAYVHGIFSSLEKKIETTEQKFDELHREQDHNPLVELRALSFAADLSKLRRLLQQSSTQMPSEPCEVWMRPQPSPARNVYENN